MKIISDAKVCFLFCELAKYFGLNFSLVVIKS